MSPAAIDDATHGRLLSDSLQRLQLKEQVPSSLSEPRERQNGVADAENGREEETALRKSNGPPSPWIGPVREGYGFRPASGPETPVVALPTFNGDGNNSPLPDPNGLGWPGEHESSAETSHLY